MAMTSVDERLLVEAHNGGDADAFASIVNEYSSSLYAHAMMRLGEARAAEDAVQETFLRAYRAMPRFEGEFHLRAWLHRILTNVCFDEGDRRRRETRTFDRLASLADPAMPAADEMLDFDRAFAEREVTTALAALPDAYREALELRYIEQLSFRQVADVTGVSEENARARVHRGRAALRRLISGPYAFVAMFIPALRKGERAAHAALGGGADGASSAASAVTVSQVSTSIAQSAPTFTRLAVELSGPMSTKAGIVAGVVAAATTVAVPVASTVADHSTAPAPTPVVAAPPADANTAPLAAPQDTTVVVDPANPAANGGATPADATATPAGATSDAATPPAQETFSAPPPAAATDGAATPTAASSTGTATTPTGAVAATAPLSSPRTLSGTSLLGTGTAEQVSLTGAATLGGSTATAGSVTGTLTITPGASADDPVRLDGTLTFAGVDGTTQSIRVAIRATATTDANGITTYAATAGRYELTDAAGASTSGALSGSIVVGLGSGSSVALSFS